MIDLYTDRMGDSIVARWYRWGRASAPGRTLVCVGTEDFWASFDAVVDDFGNLVRVPR